ncbi:MAG: alginate export family protein [Bacteroidales bacterium]|jgi:hypothetical protein|nr:alginate export family protein [Bacteroidales bacterium]
MRHLLNRSLVVLALSLAVLNQGHAQFSIDAQYRNRFAVREGYKSIIEAGHDPAFIISQRTRINMQYEKGILKLRFSPQDVRIWGDENIASSTGVFGKTASLDLYEGYVEISAAAFKLTVGRQMLVYDNQRLLGSRNWNQRGISYDAVVVKYSSGGWNIHLGGSWNTLCESNYDNYYPASRIKSLNYLWVNRKISKKFTASFMHIASGRTENDSTNIMHFLQTSGAYIIFNTNRLTFWADAFYQYGKNSGGMSVRACLLDTEIAYASGPIEPALGFSYLSGNHDLGPDQKYDHLFDPLYGARHRYFGDMDFFRDFNRNTAGAGLVDLYFCLEYKALKELSLHNTTHYFRLANTNESTPAHEELGIENDFTIKYHFREWGSLEAGYALFFPTSSLKELQGVDRNSLPQFFYIQLNITPLLLSLDHDSGSRTQ